MPGTGRLDAGQGACGQRVRLAMPTCCLLRRQGLLSCRWLHVNASDVLCEEREEVNQ